MNIEQSIKNRRSGIAMPPKVKLIAVTKNHDVNAMREAIDLGAAFIGENRVQEAMEKLETLDREVEWNLIGHLQTNKAKYAVRMFDMIHSVDSRKLALEINKEAAKINKLQDVLVQVNVAGEKSKFGIEPSDALELSKFVAGECKSLRLCGLMTIAPNFEDKEEARPIFRSLYESFKELQSLGLDNTDIKYLSMGMTNDYQIAIEEGANVVRVGTGIFGPRQY
jgi:hypothetical protein